MGINEMLRRVHFGRRKRDDARRQEKRIHRAQQQASIVRERGRAEGRGDAPGGG